MNVVFLCPNQVVVPVSAAFDVDECYAVGGTMEPINTPAVHSSWLVIIGLIGCIGTVVVVAKKRQS
jgi:hypothetical protein